MSGWLRAVRRLWSRDHGRAAAGPAALAAFDIAPIDPVQEERFVLWVLDARERTPEGAAIGTPLDEAWTVYPDAELLSRDGAPALLVRRPPRTYLLCHDGARVTRIVAGGEEYIRSLYDTLPVT